MIYFNKTIVKKLQLWYIINEFHGDVAQLARAFGSYPTGRWFESTRRYQ